MCLSNVDFAMERDGAGFVGTGYKLLFKEGEVLKGTNFLESNFSKDWMTSNGPTKFGPEYIRGFHLFLNEQDADKYSNANNKVVAKFLFKDVLAFGLNDVINAKVLCVVADKIKFVGLVESPYRVTIDKVDNGKTYKLVQIPNTTNYYLDGEIRTIRDGIVYANDGHQIGKVDMNCYKSYYFDQVS